MRSGNRFVLPFLAIGLAVSTGGPALAADLRVSSFTAPAKVAPGETAAGEIILAERVSAATPLAVQWRDSYGRIGGAAQVTVPAGGDRVDYSLAVNDPIVRRGTFEVLAGSAIVRATDFAVVFPPKPWDDYYAFVWAHTPAGPLFDRLRQYGINGAMVYRDFAGEPVKQAGFECYVDQMCWEVYAWYHKAQYDWRAVKRAYGENPREAYPLWRRPCLHEEGTYSRVEANYSKIVTMHRDDRPMFYNLADEIGLGDQSGAMDFCWEPAAREGWVAFLKARYGTLENVSREWDIPLRSWDHVRTFQPTTYRQYGRLWREVYLPKAFKGPDAPEVRQRFKSTFKSFDGIVDLYLALVTSKPVDVAYIENWIKGIDPQAAPAGSAGEQVAPEVRQQAEVAWVNNRYGTQFARLQDVADFYSSFEEWYGTLQIDTTQPDAQQMAGWNLALWCDFREYMDQTLADALARGVEIGRKYDPYGRFGFTGTHHPGAFSGVNYAKLCQAVDIIVPYNIGNAPEIIRSLYPERCIQMTPSWFSGNYGVWDIWTRFLDGDKGIIFWDNEEPKNRFLEANGEPSQRATSLGPTLRTIEAGLAKLLYAGAYDNSDIAIYYSHPSVRVAWWRQYLGTGRKWVDLQSWNLYGDSWRNLLRNSWCRLLEDCNVQFDFVSHEQVANEDRLALGGYKVLILPEVFALSELEAAKIRDFVAGGGIVIADHSPGVMDEHGKWRKEAALADLWDNQQGFLLNKSMMLYSRLRLAPGQERELRAPIEKVLFETAGIVPTVRVVGADGQPLTAAEVHTYHLGGGVRVVSIGRSLQRASEGPNRDRYKESKALEKVEAVTLVLDRASRVYDVLAGKPVGQGERFEAKLDPYVPILWTLADEELPGLQVKIEKVSGSAVDVVVDASPASTLRVARLEVLTPQGKAVEHYAANVLVRGGFGVQRVPFALNDLKGSWTVRVKDVATGQTQEVKVER